MSRSYLYRSMGPAKPIATAVLLAAWNGAAGLYLAGLAPQLLAGPLDAALADAVVGRMGTLVFSTGIVIAVAIIAVELLGGRTRLRGPRILCVAVLLAACVMGEFTVGRRIAALHAEPATPAGAVVGGASTGSRFRALHARAAVWMSAGFLAAGLALVLGVSTLRSWERHG